MSRRNQLRQEAAQVRSQIERRSNLVHQRFDARVAQLQALARSPAALPIAFIGGLLAGRLQVVEIKHAYQLFVRLARQLKGLQIVASLIGSSLL